MQNFHHCPIKVATSRVPLCAINWHVKNQTFKGLDGIIIENLQKKFNFTTVVAKPKYSQHMELVKR